MRFDDLESCEIILIIYRLFWITAFMLSLFSCTCLIYFTYDYWDNNPMLVTFKEKSTSVQEVIESATMIWIKGTFF